MSQSEKEQLWTAWRARQSISAIERQLRRKPSRIFAYLQRHNGIQPIYRSRRINTRAPLGQEANLQELTERLSLWTIEAASTVSRKVKHDNGQCRCREIAAESYAHAHMALPKAGLLGKAPDLSRIVSGKVREASVPRKLPGGCSVSSEDRHPMKTIAPRMQAGGAPRHVLGALMCRRRILRDARTYAKRLSARRQIVKLNLIGAHATEIEEAPPPRHREGDLVLGLLRQLPRHPALFRQSLTRNVSRKISARKAFMTAADMPKCTCDSRSPLLTVSDEKPTDN